MTITGVKAWPRCVETWALEIILDSKGDWSLLADVKPEFETSCEYAHIPKSYESKKGLGTWNGVGFFSYPEGLWVSDPNETYWRRTMQCRHRWEPKNHVLTKHRPPSHYMYQCTRCNSVIGTILKENPLPDR